MRDKNTAFELEEKEAAPHIQSEELHQSKAATGPGTLAIKNDTTDSPRPELEDPFLMESLNWAEAVFITSSKASALAVMEAGATAVLSIGHPAEKYAQNLLKAARDSKHTRPLLLSLDNTPSGSRTLSMLTMKLGEADILYIAHSLSGDYQSPAEALANDPDRLREKVQEGADLIHKHLEDERAKERATYQEQSAAGQLAGFREYIDEMKPVIPTGFSRLDEAIGGGLRAAFYLIGASPGAGKTTFIHQIADHLAQHKQDVLFLTLEMSNYELMAKSISRYTYTHAKRPSLRMTSIEVLDFARRKKFKPGDSIMEPVELLDAAHADLAKWGGNLHIIQGDDDISTKARKRPDKLKDYRGIREIVANHVRITGNTPVIIIDYMQIIKPEEEGKTDKENMDAITSELKRISRDLQTPVITITSYNRQSYDTGGMAAAKESGSAEYSTDVLMGLKHLERKVDPYWKDSKSKRLQYDGGEVIYKGTKKDGDIHTEPRKIELEIYKNRHGKMGGGIKFKYYSAFNYFEELEQGADFEDELEVQRIREDNRKGRDTQESPRKPTADGRMDDRQSI